MALHVRAVLDFLIDRFGQSFTELETVFEAPA
jgi:hypothetical protein